MQTHFYGQAMKKARRNDAGLRTNPSATALLAHRRGWVMLTFY
jgi:hypothetical protein